MLSLLLNKFFAGLKNEIAYREMMDFLLYLIFANRYKKKTYNCLHFLTSNPRKIDTVTLQYRYRIL